MRLPRRTLLAALAAPAIARAQPAAWPTRPVKLLVPFPPGGSNDTVARPLAERLTNALGQPFVVDNRGGAGGAIGAAQVAQAAPDGTTLMVTSSSFPTTAVLQRPAWDAERSFDPIGLLARAPFFLMLNPDFPARNLAEFLALARARPGGIDYGSSGAGGINHFITEAFCLAAGIRMNHIPYRGTAAAVTDLVAGVIPLMITTVASAAGAIRDNRIRLIAATAPVPVLDGEPLSGGAGNIPTVKQQGLDYEVAIWWGLLAPHGLPPDVRTAIHAATQTALADPALARIYAAEGASPAPGPTAEFTTLLHDDLVRWRAVAQAAHVTLE